MFKLLICGIFLSIIGWFLDKAHRFTWLMKIISRDSVNSLIALDWLAQNPNAVISPEHPGFEAILERWPNLNNKDSVRFIDRGPAYMQFGAQVRADFGLEAKDENRNQIEPGWQESSARVIFLKKLDLTIFRFGSVVFYLGIIVTFVSGILGLLNK